MNNLAQIVFINSQVFIEVYYHFMNEFKDDMLDKYVKTSNVVDPKIPIKFNTSILIQYDLHKFCVPAIFRYD